MKTACPTCGAPVEFRYDDSFVRICDHCRAAVLRSDRGVETLGKVADLVPMDSPLRLFADGHFGSKSFLLVGMAQIRHSAGGLWQEWYAKFDGGTWGWIAEAQGRYYLTLEQPAQALPPQLSFEPGSTTVLPVHGKPRTFTVSEMGSARYVAAIGELPYRLVPEGSFRFVDLSDGAGTFATIDYGEEEGDTPTLYVGSQVPIEDLGIHGGEVAPARERAIKSTRIACPSCNGSLEIRAQGQTQRIVCSYCNTLLDASSPTLAVITRLNQKPTPSIPLGSKGTFSEGEMLVIGYVQRSAQVEGVWYAFEEYLLYQPKLGFRWLVQSDGHWSYVQPVENGAVEAAINGVKYEGVKFRRYQSAQLRVDQVVGEFYWQVTAGETVESEDSIAPPAMMSRESSPTEETWSLSTYMTVDQVQHALGDRDLPFGAPQGVAPNQLNPWLSVSNVMAVAFVLLCLSAIVFAAIAPAESKAVLELKAPAVATPTVPPESPAELPNLPVECRNWTAASAAIASCEQLSRDTRDALRQAYDDAAASWVSFPAQRMAELAAPCQAGAAAVNQAAASASCAMPPPMAPLPDVPVVALPPAVAQPSNVFFSPPFQIDAGRNIELTFMASGLDNNWAYIAADLVNDATGAVVTIDGNIEHYSGYEDGESWSEGSRVTKEVIGPQPEGTYLLRVETLYGGAGELPVTVHVKQGVFRFKYFAWAMTFLMIPFLIVGLLSWSKERARWENSTAGKAPATPVSILIMVVGSVFTLIVLILKAFASSQSNDD